MDKESYFIQRLLQAGITEGIGDDAVVFSNNPFVLNRAKAFCLPNDIVAPVYAMDMFWEGTHFKKDWLCAEEIGYKAFIINISDIIAMNAIPRYALLGISLPKKISKDFIDSLIAGISKACREFGIKIIGGDTIGGDNLGIVVNMIGEAKKKILFRTGAKIGDLICHTGKIGSSYKELIYLLRGIKGNKKTRFYNPVLREGFICEVSRFAHLGMDISDGIYTELNRLSKLNKLCFRLSNLKKIYNSGEEYELVFCIAKKDYLKTTRLAKKYRINIECIGEVVRGKNRYLAKSWH